MLLRELSRHGQIVSTVYKIPLGCKSPLLQHVILFRRRVFMVLKNNDEDLNLAIKFRIDNYDYVVYATTATMKCFGCGLEGHLVRSCPNKAAEPQPGPSHAETAPAGGNQPEASADGEAGNAAGLGANDGEGHSGREGEGNGDQVQTDSQEVTEEQGDVGAEQVTEMEVEEQVLSEETKGKEPVFKRPANKAKSNKRAKKSKPTKPPASPSQSQSPSPSQSQSQATGSESENSASEYECDSSESALTEKKAGKAGVYSVEQVRRFLDDTKGPPVSVDVVAGPPASVDVVAGPSASKDVAALPPDLQEKLTSLLARLEVSMKAAPAAPVSVKAAPAAPVSVKAAPAAPVSVKAAPAAPVSGHGTGQEADKGGLQEKRLGTRQRTETGQDRTRDR
ncbi:putative uncharacterized protein DDB_G0290521 [Hoplias malabaricus]|uniref:putative uncharacterized protein DDB_G0290521 n=1 Tax=Hoplias malabaricus TaxID=27720 RepID=UPI00346335D5